VIVLASFVFWKPWGLTINTPTNMALVFVLGRLVDDAVVMMDVINRHLKKGKSPKQAAIDGAQELTFAVLATGLAFWLVLAPNLFLQGAMGIGFRGMTAPMIFAHMFSAFFALTMNPMMAAYLFKPYQERLANPLDRFFTRLFRPFIWLVEKLEWLYKHALEWSLDHRAVIMGVAVASIYAGWKVWPMLGWEGMPLQDTGQAVGEVEAWPGTPYPETEKIVSRTEEVLMRQPEVRLVSTQIGQEPAFGTYFSGFGVRTVNKAFFKVTMTHKDERVCLFYEKWRWFDRLTGACSSKTGRSVWEIMDGVQREVLQTVPGIRSMWLMEMGATPVNTARNPVEVVFKGDDVQTLAKIGDQAIKVAERAPGVVQPFTNWSMTMPQYRIEVDRARAQELGLAVPQIAMQAFYATQGGMTAEFFKPEGLEGTDRHQRMLIRYKPEQRATLEDLENVVISGPGGKHVRLKEVAKVVPSYGTDFVYKENLQYALAVLGHLDPGAAEPLQVGPDARGHDDQIGCESSPIRETNVLPTIRKLTDLCNTRVCEHPHALVGQPFSHEAGCRCVQHAREDLLFDLHHAQAAAYLGHGIQDDEADEAGANKHHTRPGLGFAEGFLGIIERPQIDDIGLIGARNRQTLRP